jgi:hypothetical protein
MPFKCEEGPVVLNLHTSGNILNEWKRREDSF